MLDLIERTRAIFELPPIKYVFFNTGLEMKATRDHVKYVAEKYGVEIEERRPEINIVRATRKYGIPFVSKIMSGGLSEWQKKGVPLSIADEYDQAEDKAAKRKELKERYVEYCNVESVYYDNAETVLGNSIRNAVEKRFPWMIVRKAKKASIIDRIRCTIRLMGAGRFWITEDCKSLQTALSDAVWNKDVKDKDERLDDGSTDIDSLDAFEYTIERDMRDLIEEVEDV